jgi:hypothetical protein
MASMAGKDRERLFVEGPLPQIAEPGRVYCVRQVDRGNADL